MTLDLSNLKSHINFLQTKQNLEWEILFGSDSQETNFSPINKVIFKLIYEKLKNDDTLIDKDLNDKTEVLDISFERKNLNNVRLSLENRNNIISFCKNQKIVLENIIKLYKFKVGKEEISKNPININDISLRSNLKYEVNLGELESDLINIEEENSKIDTYLGGDLIKIFSVKKNFRYKERYSFTTNNGFRYDLTMVKTNNQKSIYQKETGKIINVPIYSDSFKSSNVLNNPINYEVEMEYLGFTKVISLQYKINNFTGNKYISNIIKKIFTETLDYYLVDIEYEQIDKNIILNININIYKESSYISITEKIQDSIFNQKIEEKLKEYIIPFNNLEYNEISSIINNKNSQLIFEIKYGDIPSNLSLIEHYLKEVFVEVFKTPNIRLELTNEEDNLVIKCLVTNMDESMYTIFHTINKDKIKTTIDEIVKLIDLKIPQIDQFEYINTDIKDSEYLSELIYRNLQKNVSFILSIIQGTPSNIPITINSRSNLIKEEYHNLISRINSEKADLYNNILEYKFSNDDSYIDNNYLFKYLEFLESDLFLKNNDKISNKQKQENNIPYNILKEFNIKSSKNYIINNFKKTSEASSQNIFDRYISFNNIFLGTKPVTLEISNIMNKSDNINILNNFTVTDKADGISAILFIDNNGDFNLIDANLKCISLGIKNIEFKNSILNGELITEKFNGIDVIGNTYKFIAYDIYILNNKDVSYRVFSYNKEQQNENTQIYENFNKKKDEYLKNLQTEEDESNKVIINNKLKKIDTFFKKYEYLIENCSRLDLLKDTINKIGNNMIKMKTFYIPKEGETIFDISHKCWETRAGNENKFKNSSDYKYDGLIFTPLYLPVNFSYKDPLFNIFLSSTWKYNLKWKPQDENSIDFLVEYVKTESNNNQVSKKNKIYKMYENNMSNTINEVHYKALKLYNGKDKVIKNNTVCYNLYNNKQKTTKIYSKNAFFPNNPTFKNINIANIKLNEKKQALTESNEIIEDNSIVEFYFDLEETNKLFRWKPMRIRHDKTKSYHNSISKKKYIYKCLEDLYKDKSRGNLNTTFVTQSPWTEMNIEKNKYKNDIYSLLFNIENYNNNKYNKHKYLQNFKENFNKMIPSWEYIPISIQFGNDYMTAYNVWKTIFKPVTEEMITTGTNISEESLNDEVVYYNRNTINRKDSLTIHLQKFHNFIKKDILLNFYRNVFNTLETDNVNVLDLACGKGGDLYKWKQNKFSTVVGIDIVRDNIYNKENGACKRYQLLLQESKQDSKDLLTVKFDKTINPRVFFFVADSSKDIEKQLLYSTNLLEKDVYIQLWIEQLEDKNKYNPNFGSNKFNIISLQFALHYFFESKQKIEQLIENIDNNLTNNGIFIGCCFDGNRITNEFDKTENSYLEGVVDNNVIWKINKKYIDESLSIEKLGNEIGVYMYSINAEHNEYLVNFDLLTKMLSIKNIVPLEEKDIRDTVLNGYYNLENGTLPFENIYKILNSNIRTDTNYLSKSTVNYFKNIVNKMTEPEKQISFFNNAFIYKKI